MTQDAKGVNVLLVDDDDPFRDALAEELGRSGFRMEAVRDAETALREVENRTFDVAIVDLNLPGMSGEELVGELRERAPSTEVSGRLFPTNSLKRSWRASSLCKSRFSRTRERFSNAFRVTVSSSSRLHGLVRKS
jgi:CheY-like chemotaxis protein